MPPEIVFMHVVDIVVPALVITILGLPLVKVFARRLDKRDTISPPALVKIEERLARLEAGVESVAVEVERISEGQRFTTKLLAERTGQLGGGPPAGAR